MVLDMGRKPWVDLNAWSKMTDKTNEGDERCTTHKFEGICIHHECVFVCMNVYKQNVQEHTCTNTQTHKHTHTHTHKSTRKRPPSQPRLRTLNMCVTNLKRQNESVHQYITVIFSRTAIFLNYIYFTVQCCCSWIVG